MRRVEPELLDDLPPEDARARRSRRDLRRVHRAMGSVAILRRILSHLNLAAPPRRILELGAGDGTLLLRLARTLAPRWAGVELTLLDRQDLVTPQTREAYRRLDWNVEVLTADALAWAHAPPGGPYDLCVAMLFLHHFEGAELDLLLTAAAARTQAFVCCEPRRDALSRIGSWCIGLLGANDITRGDARKSVAAGFSGRELSAVWRQAAGEWITDEGRALPFTHCFSAVRSAARRGAGPHGS